ncbi:class-III pyridoxal-phosphate-dependent aminotransferase [Aminipila terrae]|uniref:Aminotransferase class III-fold pyridoxal phosphate-dependent enzyme n=1 Tax=Aminipila terrae TaxID=2697030 RepID=A0A6P1MFJ4_9FIRM|nr:aspartate aminotransferase family protein [Aminipila terrae]QHI71943.1 aminotransferase class III-fold pyridoxal phosphate-dependent enzyme [Aminipila terrae]
MNKKELLQCYDYLAPVLDYTGPIINSGKGCYVYDIDGNKYLDFNCGQFCAIFGHSDEKAAEMIYRTAKNLMHLNTNTINDEMLITAKKIHDICPEMNGRSIILSTGSEANECALRYAKNMSGNKPGIISFDCGYHGLTHGTEGYSISRKWVKPQVKNSFAVAAPPISENNSKTDIMPYVKEFEGIVKENKDIIAAALFEPIVSSGGMYLPPKEYWREIRRICDENEIYLIFDECQTGFARTGSWFYYQQIDCIPDMLVCAKSIGLGLPVSMVIFNGNTIPKDKFTMHHFSSHQNEPFAAALISYAIDEIKANNILRKIQEDGQYLLKRLEELSRKYMTFMRSPHGIGLMCGFYLNIDGMDRFQAEEQSERFCKEALRNNIIIQCTNYGRTVRLLPGYCITRDEIDFFMEALERTLDAFI